MARICLFGGCKCWGSSRKAGNTIPLEISFVLQDESDMAASNASATFWPYSDMLEKSIKEANREIYFGLQQSSLR